MLLPAQGPAPASGLLHFSTQQVPQKQRQAMWADQVRAFAGPCAIEFGDTAFAGRIDVGHLAGFACARLRQNARSVQRSRQDLAHTAPDFYYLILQLSGSATATQNDQSCQLRAGELTLIDASQPCGQHFGASSEQLTVHLPRAAVEAWAERGRLRVGTAVRGAPAAVLGSLLRPVFGEQDAFNAVQRHAIAEALLKLVAASWQGEPSDAPETLRGLAGAPLLRVIQGHIAGNLASPELSPLAVAAVHGVSVRHVHRLFSAAGTSFGEWLRNCRLERCAADLRDRAHSQRSITDIAFAWGFNESAHFSRAFKAAYGSSPRQYRQAFFSTPAAALLND